MSIQLNVPAALNGGLLFHCLECEQMGPPCISEVTAVKLVQFGCFET